MIPTTATCGQTCTKSFWVEQRKRSPLSYSISTSQRPAAKVMLVNKVNYCSWKNNHHHNINVLWQASPRRLLLCYRHKTSISCLVIIILDYYCATYNAFASIYHQPPIMWLLPKQTDFNYRIYTCDQKLKLILRYKTTLCYLRMIIDLRIFRIPMCV